MGSQSDNDDPAASQRSAFNALLSNAIQAAATRSLPTSTVTQTVEMGEPFYTSVDLDRPSTNTIAADDGYPYSSIGGASTLATPTSTFNSYQNGTASTASADTTVLPLLTAGDGDEGDGGLSGGQLAAAIVAPVVFTALLAVLAFLILRRRRSRRRNTPDSHSSGSARGTSFFGLREKWGTLKSSASSQKEPEITSTQNRAYMSGLDTSSRGTSQQNSGEYSAAGRLNNEPPPPYKVDAQGAPVLPFLARDLSRFNFSRPATPQEMSQLQVPRNAHFQQPSPESPLSPLTPSFLTPWATEHRPDSSRSARSITSDAYSETASIHSARAARMSVGAPTVITTRAHFHSSRSGSLGDPFDDPNTPVPSLSGDSLAKLDVGQRRGSEE